MSQIGRSSNRAPVGQPISTAAGLLLVLGGCVGAHYVPASSTAYPARAEDCAIEVFTTAPTDRGYEEIGLVEGEGTEWKANTADLLPKLKEQACLAGGDAIVLLFDDKFAQGEDGHPVLRSVATVIRWTQGEQGSAR